MIADECWYEDDRARITPDAFLRDFEELKTQQQMRIQFDRFWCSLYYDRAYQGFSDGREWSEIFVDLLDQNSGRLNENVILRIVATLAAKFARQKSHPTILTTLGDWGLQRRAERYSRMIEGVLSEIDIYDLQRLSDLHNIICGTGAIHIYSRNGRIKGEVIPPWELYFHPHDSRRMKPSIGYRRQLIGRRRLMKLYPKHADAIENAQGVSASEAFDALGSSNPDVLEVVTGWHLPTDDESEDGRLLVAIPGVKLVDDEWCRPRFPFAFARYMIPPDGMFGIGIVAQLV